jgi:hypothetical protein
VDVVIESVKWLSSSTWILLPTIDYPRSPHSTNRPLSYVPAVQQLQRTVFEQMRINFRSSRSLSGVPVSHVDSINRGQWLSVAIALSSTIPFQCRGLLNYLKYFSAIRKGTSMIDFEWIPPAHLRLTHAAAAATVRIIMSFQIVRVELSGSYFTTSIANIPTGTFVFGGKNRRTKKLAAPRFDRGTSGLWALRAIPAAPCCSWTLSICVISQHEYKHGPVVLSLAWPQSGAAKSL